MRSPDGVLGAWVHNLDPEIVHLWGNFAVRWYGLAYLAGFVAGYFVLRWLAKRDLWVVKPEQVGDFIAYAAIFGVFLGGRLGYVLFYMLPDRPQAIAEDPLVVFKVWEGGMSSHGGILGLTIFTWIYARKKALSWPGVGDGLVIAAPLGICFGRLANFINGELYGRVAEGVPWAMKFPKELLERENSERFEGAMGEAVQVDPEALGPYWQAYQDSLAIPPGAPADSSHWLFEAVIERSRENDSLLEVLGTYVQARHPSQLYQALLEGLLLCVLLFLVRLRWSRMPHGVLTGLFFLLYAGFRIVVEQFREPDAAWVIENVLTKGQFYSIFMVGVGLAFLVAAMRGKTGRLEPGGSA